MNPIDLGLGQRVGPLLLDRVLRRQHEERPWERMCRVSDRDLLLLHRLEQRGLHLGRRPVDLVSEHDVREHRATPNLEVLRPLVVDHRADQVGREKIRGELNPLKIQLDRLGQRVDGQGLGQAWHALQQHVTTGQQPDQHALDHVVLTDDALARLRAQRLDEGALSFH
jgi:hypothetical protein